MPASSTGSEACASVIRSVHFIPPTFKRRQQQRRTRLRRKHKTQRSATTNDLAVSCARRAALSFLLLFSSFTSQPECALKKITKEFINKVRRDEERKSEIAITGMNSLSAALCGLELDHALFAFSIRLMTAASGSASEFFRFRSEPFAIEATSSAPRPDASSKRYASSILNWHPLTSELVLSDGDLLKWL